MLIGGERIRHGDTKLLDGGLEANIRYLLGQTISMLALAVCKYDFSRLGPVKFQIVVLRPPVYMIQFCLPGIGISNIRIIRVLEHQVSNSKSGEICGIRPNYIRCWADSIMLAVMSYCLEVEPWKLVQ